jgi:hypothetical protein
MALNLLDYTSSAVPAVVKDAVKSYTTANPLWKAMVEKRRMQLAGGPNVRFVYVKQRHSNAQEVSQGTNWTVTPTWQPIMDQASLDWGQYALPLVIVHENRDRCNDQADYKRLVTDIVNVTMDLLWSELWCHVLLGSVYGGSATVNQFNRIGTLNGAVTSLLSSGATAGALQAATPSAQAGTYLNRPRTYDSTNQVNFWYNQYAQHGGISVNFIEKVKTIKRYAIARRAPGTTSKGPTHLVIPLSNMEALERQLTVYPGTGHPQVMLSLAEAESGKVAPTITMLNGMEICGDWLWDTFGSGALAPSNEPAYVLDPTALTLYVSRFNDFKPGRFVDMSQFGQYFDIAFMRVGLQFICNYLPGCGILTK